MTSLPDQVTHQWNRETPANLFECHLHPELHDAEVYVVYMTAFGQASIPVCAGGAIELIRGMEGQHGIREVYKETPAVVRGTIEGVLSNR